MKVLRIAFAAAALFFLTNANAQTDTADTSTVNPIAHLTQVVALDANRDNQLTAQGVHKGYDTFIAREIVANDTNIKNTFVGRDGKTYVAITLDELRTLDKSKKGVLQASDLQRAKSPLITARMLEDSDQIIVERPLDMSVKSITLPAAGQTAGVAIGWDNNQILIQQINL